MNRRAFIILMCAGALGCVVSTAWGAPKSYTGKFVGQIVKIIGNTIQVYVTEIDKIVSFWTDQRTKITRNKSKVEFADLKIGQTVTVDASMGRAKAINIDAEAKSEASD